MNKEDFYQSAKSYLESNACGMWDGSLKASMHRKMSELFLARKLGIEINKVASLDLDGEDIVGLVRESTLSLTDNLDIKINFPLETAPNYKKLVPVFVDKFLELANDWFEDQVCLLSDDALIDVLERITRNKMSHTLQALESYGFEFVEGSNEKQNSFLTMRSKLGQIVTVKPNMYFGCSFNIDSRLNKGK